MKNLMLCCALALVPFLPAADSAQVTVDSSKRDDVVCRLVHTNDDAPAWMVWFQNRSGRGVRVDYRVLSHVVAKRSGSVILRPTASGDDKEATSDQALIHLPAAGKWYGADILRVTPGTVREKTVSRVSASGVSEQITELELVEDVAANTPKTDENQERLTKAEKETARLKDEVDTLRRERERDAERQAAPPRVVVVQQESRELTYRRTLIDLELLRLAREREAERRHLITPPTPAPEKQDDSHSPVTGQPGMKSELENERKAWPAR